MRPETAVEGLDGAVSGRAALNNLISGRPALNHAVSGRTALNHAVSGRAALNYRYWPVLEMVSMARPASLPLAPETRVRM